MSEPQPPVGAPGQPAPSGPLQPLNPPGGENA